MAAFKIATWNVNSIRVRLSQVLTWLSEVQPDVLALQEIKVQDHDFPRAEFESLGYQVIHAGQKTFNGVAIICRKELADIVTDIPGFTDPQRRVLGVTLGDLRILNLYVPNGESLLSDKYHYKLNWLKKLDEFIREQIRTHSKMIILGDFNIAPHDHDVYDPLAWAGCVLVSEPERKAFADLLELGFHDCFRLHEQPEKSFSWWDYRLNSFKRNLGVRIDHILATPTLAALCQSCTIDKIPRGWERPSDHTPVVAEFEV